MRILFIAVFALLLQSCATTKNQTKTPKKFDEIEFGSKGGFTGAQNNYLIEAKGDVYKLTDGTSTIVNNVTKSEIRDISKQIKQYDLYNLEKNETGNMTYFIEVKAGDISNKISWGAGAETEELFEVYKKLMNTIKPKSDE